MLKGRGTIIFFAVMALIHVINGAPNDPPAPNPFLHAAKSIFDTVETSVGSGIEKVKETAESIQTSVASITVPIGSAMQSPTTIAAPALPTSAALKADSDGEPALPPAAEESA